MYTPVLTEPFWRLDARRKWRLIESYVPAGSRILEVGSGPGTVLRQLRQLDFDVVGLDVANNAINDKLRPIVYDGKRMPFRDIAFDVALILTVLHHAEDPETVLRETSRVAKRVIVLEDVYDNPFQRFVTLWADSFFNWEFSRHPHNNRSDREWRNLFQLLGLEVNDYLSFPFLGLFRQALYVLDGRGAIG